MRPTAASPSAAIACRGLQTAGRRGSAPRPAAEDKPQALEGMLGLLVGTTDRKMAEVLADSTVGLASTAEEKGLRWNRGVGGPVVPPAVARLVTRQS